MHLSSVQEQTREVPQLRAFEKVVYFVRHGESEANIRPEGKKMDPALIDAPLTGRGMLQARSVCVCV